MYSNYARMLMSEVFRVI